MRQPPLELLSDGVHVAKALLEGVRPEDRRSARGVVGGVGDRLRLLDRVAGGESDHDPLLHGYRVARRNEAPSVDEHTVKIGPRGAEPRLELRHQLLSSRAFGEAMAEAARRLVAG